MAKKKKLIYVPIILLIIWLICPKHPSNKALIAKFQKNKADFEELRQMYLEDKNLNGIGKYNTNEKYLKLGDDEMPGISSEREEKYFGILDKINIDGMGTWARNDNEEKTGIFFNISRFGGALGGSIKRYIWFKEKPEKLLIKQGSEFQKIQQIEDFWYLSYESH
ncbi:MAG: hypothetical protein ACYS6K_00685 [Planctomycetota bacterium]